MRFIVPFGRDGAADRAARAFVRPLSGTLASATEVENLPGEGGLAGVRRANELARAGTPTMLLGTPTTHVLLRSRLGEPGRPDASLGPLAGLGSAPNVLMVSARLEVGDVEGLVERARRDRLAFASAGTGQTIHVCSAYFASLAGIRMRHVPYDAGSASAYADVIRGTVHVYFDSLLGARERIAAGDVVPLAVSSTRRHPQLPQVPTLAECGYPRHALDVWLGVFSTLPVPWDGAAIQGELAALGLAGGLVGADGLTAEIERSRGAWEDAYRAAVASE